MKEIQLDVKGTYLRVVPYAETGAYEPLISVHVNPLTPIQRKALFLASDAPHTGLNIVPVYFIVDVELEENDVEPLMRVVARVGGSRFEDMPESEEEDSKIFQDVSFLLPLQHLLLLRSFSLSPNPLMLQVVEDDGDEPLLPPQTDNNRLFILQFPPVNTDTSDYLDEIIQQYATPNFERAIPAEVFSPNGPAVPAPMRAAQFYLLRTIVLLARGSRDGWDNLMSLKLGIDHVSHSHDADPSPADANRDEFLGFMPILAAQAHRNALDATEQDVELDDFSEDFLEVNEETEKMHLLFEEIMSDPDLDEVAEKVSSEYTTEAKSSAFIEPYPASAAAVVDLIRTAGDGSLAELTLGGELYIKPYGALVNKYSTGAVAAAHLLDTAFRLARMEFVDVEGEGVFAPSVEGWRHLVASRWLSGSDEQQAWELPALTAEVSRYDTESLRGLMLVTPDGEPEYLRALMHHLGLVLNSEGWKASNVGDLIAMTDLNAPATAKAKELIFASLNAIESNSEFRDVRCPGCQFIAASLADVEPEFESLAAVASTVSFIIPLIADVRAAVEGFEVGEPDWSAFRTRYLMEFFKSAAMPGGAQ